MTDMMSVDPAAAAAAMADFEAKIKADMKADMEAIAVQCATVEKEDWLNAQCKSMEVDIKVTGVHYRVKDYQKKNAKARSEWRADMLRRIFVETRVVEEDVLFDTRTGGKKVLRDVVKNMHPLGQKDKSAVIGPTIIIAFTQSSIANDIKEAVRKDSGLELTKPKRAREAEMIKIFAHLPPILEALRNECLRERRAMISTPGNSKRFICNESLVWPWVSLMAVGDDSKTPIPFKVEDARLANPARTLALNHLRGVRKFTPYHVLSADEKKAIGPGIMTSVDNPTERLRNAVAVTDMVTDTSK